MAASESLTGAISHRPALHPGAGAKRRKPSKGKWLELERRARQQPQATSMLDIPLGSFVVHHRRVGVGQVDTVIDTLYPALARRLNGAREHPGAA